AAGDYVLLLNPDTEVVGNAPQELVAYLQAHPDVGLVGPRLLNSDGTPQSSRRRFPNLAILFLESTWLQPLLSDRQLRRYCIQDRPDTEEQDVDWVTGAAMMIRREVLQDVGPFDESYFMYSEELDWCRRIRRAGWRITYVPSAQVIHHGGKSSDQVVAARHVYFQASKILYARKHHGRSVAEVLRFWLLGQYVWQSALEGLKWLLNHRRKLRAERIRAYWRVISSGLRQPHRAVER
ncbi:MAG: glycosyltransferase family 2 protein, partial [Anaerolineae bacterium]|nr:glycosyltransferase family 2 protein [Anaerolineae bacterium]